MEPVLNIFVPMLTFVPIVRTLPELKLSVPLPEPLVVPDKRILLATASAVLTVIVAPPFTITSSPAVGWGDNAVQFWDVP